MAPAKGRGRPKKTVDAKTDDTTTASAKSPAKSPKVAQNSAENGAKKGRGRPAGKVTKPAKSPAKAKVGGAKPKKDAAVEPKQATPTKRKAEEELPDSPAAKSPKTENTKKAGGRGRPKKAGGAATKKPTTKSPAAKKGGRGRKPAESDVAEAATNGVPITINMNVVIDGKKVDKKSVKVSKKRAISDTEINDTEVVPTKKRGSKKVKNGEVEEKSTTKKVVKEKKGTLEQKPKLNKVNTNYKNIDFNLDKEHNFKISSWNVAGLRAWIEKNGLEFLQHEKPDILCLQETKCVEDQLPDVAKNIKGYHPYWLCMPGGHAGIAIYSKIMPYNVEYGIGDEEFDSDGRILTAEYEKFYLVCTYVPNAGRKLVTLDKRLRWNKLFENYLKKLDAKKPVIIAGDMNVAHEEIDLTNPKTNKRNAGFTQEERDGMTKMLSQGFIDTFRHFYPNQREAYTFWSYMGNARAKNVGWRLDYFIASERFLGKIVDNVIRKDVLGSDHCPITLFLKL